MGQHLCDVLPKDTTTKTQVDHLGLNPVSPGQKSHPLALAGMRLKPKGKKSEN